MKNGVYVSLIDGHLLCVDGDTGGIWTLGHGCSAFISDGNWAHQCASLRIILGNYEYLSEL